MPTKFEVNGKPVSVDVEPRLTLADCLRHELRLIRRRQERNRIDVLLRAGQALRGHDNLNLAGPDVRKRLKRSLKRGGGWVKCADQARGINAMRQRE